MINKVIITKSLNNVISKCSRSNIQNKLNKYSDTEKKDLLNNKLNPAEWLNYDYAKKEVKEITNLLDEYKDAPDDEHISIKYEFFNDKTSFMNTMQNRLKRYSDEIYFYEKRILNDYSINKNPVPEIDKSLYKIDDNGDSGYGVTSFEGPLEKAQINNQRSINFTDFEKNCLSEWWGDGHKAINRSNYNALYSYEKEDKNFINTLGNYKRGISSAIHKSDGLLEPMVMFHGGRFDIHLNPGDKIKWDGYVSLSFNQRSAEGFDGNIFFGKALFKCYTPAQLKGVCGNDKRLGNFHATEHEYLADRGIEGTILGIDYENNIVEVLIE